MAPVHFLIVDDEGGMRRALARTIQGEYSDCTISEAGSAAEALGMLDAHMFFDVIMSDNSMPGGLKGLEFLRQVAARFPRSVRILVTADRDSGQYAAAVFSGLLFAYLAKPWDPAELRAVIRNAVAKVLDPEGVQVDDDPDDDFDGAEPDPDDDSGEDGFC
ncbi:response regulator [Candidatus Uhrbacteria bacterium]|nr:response regulator [Candidatus Uhrbacteria bacterium]